MSYRQSLCPALIPGCARVISNSETQMSGVKSVPDSFFSNKIISVAVLPAVTVKFNTLVSVK